MARMLCQIWWRQHDDGRNAYDGFTLHRDKRRHLDYANTQLLSREMGSYRYAQARPYWTTTVRGEARVSLPGNGVEFAPDEPAPPEPDTDQADPMHEPPAVRDDEWTRGALAMREIIAQFYEASAAESGSDIDPEEAAVIREIPLPERC